MTEEMWTHENESQEFREGFRAGLEHSLETVIELVHSIQREGKTNEAAWVNVAVNWIDDELSMYQVGDE